MLSNVIWEINLEYEDGWRHITSLIKTQPLMLIDDEMKCQQTDKKCVLDMVTF